MFTGIVEALGTVGAVDARADGRRIRIEASAAWGEVGDSVAINGCCLTVVDAGDGWWAFDAVPETLARTNLGELAPGSPVNLERPLAADGRFGGHVVQGHVDGVGTVRQIEALGDGSYRVTFDLPPDLMPYIVEKGSLTVDGVSLTVAALRDGGCEIAVIPHTWAVTRFGGYEIGTRVNVEVDILSKYVERLLQAHGALPAGVAR